MIEKCESGDHYVGFFRGKVVKHLPHGYCKIYIPGVYPESCISNPNTLPDAEQASPLFAGTNNGNGVFSYPNISSTVWCFFANGDQNFPVYFASTLGGPNAFGQHEIVMPPRYEEGKKLSDVISTEISSTQHLITSGKDQILFDESGALSIQISNPIRTEASVDFNNQYQLQRQDDHVVSRRLVEQIQKKQIGSTDCTEVIDVNSRGGLLKHNTQILNYDISAKTFSNNGTFVEQYNDGNLDYGLINLSGDTTDTRELYSNMCHNSTSQTQNIVRHSLSASGQLTTESDNSFTINNDQITINTVNFDKNSNLSATSSIKAAAKDDTGVFLETENHDTKLKCVVNINSKEGLIELKVEDLDAKTRSYMYLDKKGKVTIDASESITLKAPSIQIKAIDPDKKLGRFNTLATYTTMSSDTSFNIVSKAVDIASTVGKTIIRSTTEKVIV